MKICWFVSILGLFCFLSADGQNRAENKGKDLLGSVKTIHITTTRFLRQHNKWVETQPVPIETSTYDTTGKLTDIVFFSPDGSTIRKQVSVHNEKELLTEYTIYNLNVSRWLLSRRHVNTYNEEGKIAEAADYSRDGMLIAKAVYDYDGHKRKTECTIYSPDGSISSKMATIYDEKGRAIQVAYYNSDGAQRERLVYSYIPERRAIEIARYDSNNTICDRSLSAYDDRGNLVEESHFKAGDVPAEKVICTYEFDSTGNWIKKTVSNLVTRSGKSNLEPSQVIYRVSTYY